MRPKLGTVAEFDHREKIKSRNALIFVVLIVFLSVFAIFSFVRWFHALPYAQVKTVQPQVEARRMAETQPTEKSFAEKHLIENLGNALTDQYDKGTQFDVHVTGNDVTGSLIFDCSGDPSPVRTCLMLYKNYPDASEAQLLRISGVKRLYFNAGLTRKSWQKDL